MKKSTKNNNKQKNGCSGVGGELGVAGRGGGGREDKDPLLFRTEHSKDHSTVQNRSIDHERSVNLSVRH